MTPETTINPLISGNHFFALSFLIFKLSESFWNRFKLILLDEEMNFKKITKKYYFFMSKNDFSKKFDFPPIFFRKTLFSPY